GKLKTESLSEAAHGARRAPTARRLGRQDLRRGSAGLSPCPCRRGAARIPGRPTRKVSQVPQQPGRPRAHPSCVRTRIHTPFWAPYLPWKFQGRTVALFRTPRPPPSWVACTLPGRACPSRRCPTARSVPTWLKLTSEDVKGQIYKLAKEGLTPSQIGVILRDAHGVAQLRFVTGNKILRILKSKGLAPDLPEDLYHLIKKAVAV
uniref:Small ribosomal subunit protein uS15 N-terminal domain-containing protein n=1 Tax=Rattus norvegicus TaxID=10116 RepID=A0ABK0M697_RAT